MATNTETSKQVERDHEEMTRPTHQSDNHPDGKGAKGKDAGKYPRMKYNVNESVQVNSAEEEAALKGKYYDTPNEVPENAHIAKESGDTSGFIEAAPQRGPKGPQRNVPAPVGPNNSERDRLNFQAEGLGLKLDPAWTNEYCMHFIRMSASS